MSEQANKRGVNLPQPKKLAPWKKAVQRPQPAVTLGPVAHDALPAIKSSRQVNPVLGEIAAWAIDPSADVPWRHPPG